MKELCDRCGEYDHTISDDLYTLVCAFCGIARDITLRAEYSEVDLTDEEYGDII